MPCRPAALLFVFSFAAALALSAADSFAAEPSQPTVQGTIIFEGDPPERDPIQMSRDAKCVELHGDEPVLDESVMVGENGELQDVFVYVKRGLPRGKEYPLPDEPAVLDQKGCMYRPRVQGVRVGQSLEITNSDDLTHNVHGQPYRNRPFNMGQIGKGVRERTFDREERRPVEVRCDIHTWMRAYLFILDHPFFAVTGEDGRFSIEDLPPGEYTLAAWHEKMGEKRQEITVTEDGTMEVDFNFETDDLQGGGPGLSR